MSGPVQEVVVASVDPSATAAFLATFDLTVVASVELDTGSAELLAGRSSPGGTALRLASPHATGTATVLVVPTTSPGAAPSGWSAGPRALDLYSADLDASIEVVRSAGGTVSPEAVITGGPMRMRQVLVRGPEGLPVVLVDSTHRRSSVCDVESAPLHSEPHSVVWCVDDHPAEVARWAAAGWSAGATIGFAEPSVSDELGLPERPTPITMTMLSDTAVSPVRVELLSFDDHRSEPAAPGPLASLLVAVEDTAAATAAWGSEARIGPAAVLGDGRHATPLTTPGGVRLVLVGGC